MLGNTFFRRKQSALVSGLNVLTKVTVTPRLEVFPNIYPPGLLVFVLAIGIACSFTATISFTHMLT